MTKSDTGQAGESFFEIMTKIKKEREKEGKNAAVTLGRFIARKPRRVVKYVFAAIVKQIFMASKFLPAIRRRRNAVSLVELFYRCQFD